MPAHPLLSILPGLGLALCTLCAGAETAPGPAMPPAPQPALAATPGAQVQVPEALLTRVRVVHHRVVHRKTVVTRRTVRHTSSSSSSSSTAARARPGASAPAR